MPILPTGSAPLDWYSATETALLKLWTGFISLVPRLFGAAIVFCIGWLLALGLGKLISAVLSRLKLDEIFEKTGWVEALGKAKISGKPSEFLGGIVKWVIVIAFLVVSVDILEFDGLGRFLGEILAYLPNVIIAVLIFVVTVIVSDIAGKIVVASVEKVKVGYAKLVGRMVKSAIWFFAISAILLQLGIFPPQLIVTLFTGLVNLVVISLGLAFGLGGKDIAAEALRKLKRDIEEK